MKKVSLSYFLNYLSDYYFKRKGILIDAPRKKSQQYKQDEVFFLVQLRFSLEKTMHF